MERNDAASREPEEETARGGYSRIDEYAVIGDLQTCALVGPDGSIDWCCFPHLASPSVFAALLDSDRGGFFAIRPVDAHESTVSYIPETNCLQTRFSARDGRLVLTDFMPVRGSMPGGRQTILRKLFCMSGRVEVEADFRPTFNYGQHLPRLKHVNGDVGTEGAFGELWLQTPFPLHIDGSGAYGRATLRQGQTVWFVLCHDGHEPVRPEDCENALKQTVHFWLDWSRSGLEERLDFEPFVHNLAVRSGLVLKLLSCSDTGGIAAAATTSLPEIVHGVRNWDYRYAWIRDAAFTVQALSDLGHHKEAYDYFRWIAGLCGTRKKVAGIEICYRLDGRPVPEEQEISTLRGYRDSRPVRIGNQAVRQFQLDIYGELVNAMFEAHLHGGRLPKSSWGVVSSIADYVCQKWQEPDSGIWEMRRPPAHYTYSKLMAWVAIDRAVRLGKALSQPIPSHGWEETASKIRHVILEQGFNQEVGSFVQTLNSRDLDATGLLIPALGFLDPKDPRVLATLDATRNNLTADGLVFRYRMNDGLPGQESPFVLCSFWLVNALALAGQIDRAEEIFEGIASRASRAGLFGEEIDVLTGEHRGNFPQAFSHIGLINSSFYLLRARQGKAGGPKSTQEVRKGAVS